MVKRDSSGKRKRAKIKIWKEIQERDGFTDGGTAVVGDQMVEGCDWSLINFVTL